MSADNYLLIRKQDGKYWLTDESASADEPDPIRPERAQQYDTLIGAIEGAHTYMEHHIVEYGLSVQVETTPCPHCSGTGVVEP